MTDFDPFYLSIPDDEDAIEALRRAAEAERAKLDQQYNQQEENDR